MFRIFAAAWVLWTFAVPAVCQTKALLPAPAPETAAAQAKASGAAETPALRYKSVSLTPGGFIAAESVWRQRELQADIASPFNSLPLAGTAFSNISEFRISARQSRMNLLAETVANQASVSGFVEFDLLGAGLTSNSNESNSYMPRVRHAWFHVAWTNGWSVAAGQMWTLAQANRKGISPVAGNAYLPDMIDAQYVVGLDWLRQPSVRVVKRLGSRVWMAASAEGAQTTFSARNPPANFMYCSPGTANLTSTANYSFDRAPDLIVKIAAERGAGHYELKGVARFFRDRVYPGNPPVAAAAYNAASLGGGIGASASWTLLKKLDLSLNALLGNGVGRYGTSQLPDVTVRADGSLAPIHGGQGLALVEFTPQPKLKLYLYGGSEYAGRAWYTTASGTGAGYGSPLNDNTGCGVEAVPSTSTAPASGRCAADTRSLYQLVSGFWYRPLVGSMGRVQYGVQYSYTERNAWAGLGGKPKGTENMIFSSVRYYLP